MSNKLVILYVPDTLCYTDYNTTSTSRLRLDIDSYSVDTAPPMSTSFTLNNRFRFYIFTDAASTLVQTAKTCQHSKKEALTVVDLVDHPFVG